MSVPARQLSPALPRKQCSNKDLRICCIDALCRSMGRCQRSNANRLAQRQRAGRFSADTPLYMVTTRPWRSALDHCHWPYPTGESARRVPARQTHFVSAASAAATKTYGSAGWTCLEDRRLDASGHAPIDWHGRQRAGTRNVTAPVSSGPGDAELLHLPLQRRARAAGTPTRLPCRHPLAAGRWHLNFSSAFPDRH
jgi:hypothetical protein